MLTFLVTSIVGLMSFKRYTGIPIDEVFQYVKEDRTLANPLFVIEMMYDIINAIRQSSELYNA